MLFHFFTQSNILKYLLLSAALFAAVAMAQTGFDSPVFCESMEIIETDELLRIASVINGEAEGESLAGKLAVGTVIMNRGGVSALRVDQFDGMRGRTSPTSESIRAAHLVLDGVRNLPPDVIFFCNPKISTDKKWVKYLGEAEYIIGKHEFHVKPSKSYRAWLLKEK